MLKSILVAMGLLAAASIAQPSLAANNASNFTNSAIDRPADNLHAQLIIKIGDSARSNYPYRYSDRDRERYERERDEANRRRYYYEREYRRERYRDRFNQRYDYRH